MSEDALSERLDAILRGPDAIEAQTFFRVVRPILALTGWRAQLATQETLTLVAMPRTVRPTPSAKRLGRDSEAARQKPTRSSRRTSQRSSASRSCESRRPSRT